LSSVAFIEGETRLNVYEGDYERIEARDNLDPLYLVALASDREIDKPVSSIFLGRLIFQAALRQKEQELKNTLSFKTGNFLLQPLRIIRNVFKKQGHLL